MIEVEFLCANSDFPLFQSTLRKHQQLYNKFKTVRGLLPYRQDFSEGDDKQFSFAVLVATQPLLAYVKEEAAKASLAIDIVDKDVLDSKVAGIVAGRIDYPVTCPTRPRTQPKPHKPQRKRKANTEMGEVR